MQITITIPDTQWQEFQHLAQEVVETKWNGSYEDFVIYIMMVNLENYIENQKRKQEKKMKRALASYEESLKREQDALTASPEPASPLPGKKQPEDKPKNAVMTDKELSARILQLQAIAVEKRTLAEENELNDLASNAQGESQEEVGL